MQREHVVVAREESTDKDWLDRGRNGLQRHAAAQQPPWPAGNPRRSGHGLALRQVRIIRRLAHDTIVAGSHWARRRTAADTSPTTDAAERYRVRRTPNQSRAPYGDGVREVAEGVSNRRLAIAWLANKLAPFDVTLEPGHMMLSGSFTRPLWAQKGDTLHADFGPLGGVAVQFV